MILTLKAEISERRQSDLIYRIEEMIGAIEEGYSSGDGWELCGDPDTELEIDDETEF